MICIRRTIAAPDELLWEACATGPGLAGWQADEVIGEIAEGKRITLRWPALKLELPLRVVERIERERVALELGDSRLTLALAPGQLVLTHEGLRSEDEFLGMRSAWEAALGILAHGLELHGGHRRRVAWFVQSAPAVPALAYVYFTDAGALREWLVDDGGIGGQGSPLTLSLKWGPTLTGRVLANSPDRDIAISWQEDRDSCLVFRTFPSPFHPTHRILAIAWSRWSQDPFPDPERRGIEASLARLARVLGQQKSA